MNEKAAGEIENHFQVQVNKTYLEFFFVNCAMKQVGGNCVIKGILFSDKHLIECLNFVMLFFVLGRFYSFSLFFPFLRLRLLAFWFRYSLNSAAATLIHFTFNFIFPIPFFSRILLSNLINSTVHAVELVLIEDWIHVNKQT